MIFLSLTLEGGPQEWSLSYEKLTNPTLLYISISQEGSVEWQFFIFFLLNFVYQLKVGLINYFLTADIHIIFHEIEKITLKHDTCYKLCTSYN